MPGVWLSTLVRRMRRELPPDGDSDAELLARFAQTRDASAFELLVWRHGGMVLSACRRLLHHDTDAEDAFQAVFLVLARKARGITRGTALPAWLHRTAVRIAARLARSRRASVTLPEDVAEPSEPDPAVAGEVLRVLEEEIDRLPDRCRRAVVLCYLEGLTAAEAGVRLGCPTGTVESRLAAARKRLCERLTRRGIALPAVVFTTLGSAGLAPGAAARATQAAVVFARGGVGAALSDQSVRLAKGVLVMSRIRTWAAVGTVALVALTATAGVAWSENQKPRLGLPTVEPMDGSFKTPDPPEVDPRIKEALDKVRREPKADPDKPAAHPWGGKSVWVASTAARLYDVSPDGTRYLYADGRKFGVFDRATGTMAWQLDNSTIHSAQLSPNGRTIVAGEWQEGVKLYDAATGKKLYEFIPMGSNGAERAWQATFRPDGTILFQTNSSYSYTITHWDPVARREISSVTGEIKPKDSHIWVWQRGAGFFLEKHEAHGISTTTRRTVSYTDPLTGKTTPTLDIDLNDTVFDLTADGKHLLIRTVGKSPRILDTATGKTLLNLHGHKQVVTGGAFSQDGKYIATVSGTELSDYDRAKLTGKFPGQPAEVVVWDAKTGKELARWEFPTTELNFVEVQFSADSKFLVALSRDGTEKKARKLIALGAVPFAETGGAQLNFPADEPPPPPKPPVVIPPKTVGIVGDPLDRFIDEIAKTIKPAADKVDLLFVAALGRFATATEQKRVKDKYGDKMTADVLRALLEEMAKMPEYEAHIKSLLKRSPSKLYYDPWAPYDQPLRPHFGPPELDATEGSALQWVGTGRRAQAIPREWAEPGPGSSSKKP